MTLGRDVWGPGVYLVEDEATIDLSLSPLSLGVTSLLPLNSLLPSLGTEAWRDLDLDLDLDLARTGSSLTATAAVFLSFLSRSLFGFTLRLGILARLRDRRLRSVTGAASVRPSPTSTDWVRLRGTLALTDTVLLGLGLGLYWVTEMSTSVME